MQSFLLIVKLCNDLEATDGKKVEDAFFQHDFVVFRVYNLDNAHDSLPVLALHVVQIEHLLKEISCLLVSQIAKVFLVESVIEDLDVVDSLFELFLADLVNALFVIIEHDREENGAHVEDYNADEQHEENNGVEVSVIGWKHEVWEVLRRE